MILLDTSVLSLVFRRRRGGEPEPRVAAILRRLVGDDAPMGVPGIVLQELLSGVRTPHEFDRLMGILEGFPLVIARRDDHLAAARIANACARKGVPTSTVDCLIAAIAITRQAALFTLDADFARMAEPSGLTLFEVPGGGAAE
jgi:predicted nucleic acid-binding protein